MKHRTEIDGLRAFAVIPVLFYHAHFLFFSGGFIGVDVFFVISGFLITSVISQDIQKNSFSIAGFYERRARRILPALFVVLLFCLVPAWYFLFPEDLENFGKSLIASSVFLVNLFFEKKMGYFSPDIEKTPLIHLWSLSVEEQFYLLYPIFFYWTARSGRKWTKLILLTVMGVSLGFAIFYSSRSPSANFYSSFSRAWELLLGGLAAESLDMADRVNSRERALLSAFGLGLICFSVLSFNANTPWPGFSTVIPTVGTALVLIFGKADTWTAKLLSLKVFAGVGLISYSLYLWHQTLFAFLVSNQIERPTSFQYFALIALSMLLAYWTWRFVERPFRDRTLYDRGQIFRFSAGGLLFFLLCGYGFASVVGWGAGYKGAFLRQHEWLEPQKKLDRTEFAQRTGDEAKAPMVALWGDSHASAISASVDRVLREKKLGGVFFIQPGCPPILGVYRQDLGAYGERELEFNERTMNYILGDKDISTVILIARWSLNIEGTRTDNGEGGVENGNPALLLPFQMDVRSNEERKEAIALRIEWTIKRLIDAKKKVILVYPVPEIGFNVPEADLQNYLSGKPPVTVSDAFYRRRNQFVDGLFDSLPKSPWIKKVFTEKAFLDPNGSGRCLTVKNNKLLYVDDNHLSVVGADLLVSAIEKYLPVK